MSKKGEQLLEKAKKVAAVIREKGIAKFGYSDGEFEIELIAGAPKKSQLSNQKEIETKPAIPQKYITARFVGLFAKTTFEVGDTITDEDIIGNIFSMNINHPVKANCTGTIKEILVAEKDPVDYGAKIAIVE